MLKNVHDSHKTCFIFLANIVCYFQQILFAIISKHYLLLLANIVCYYQQTLYADSLEVCFLLLQNFYCCNANNIQSHTIFQKATLTKKHVVSISTYRVETCKKISVGYTNTRIPTPCNEYFN